MNRFLSLLKSRGVTNAPAEDLRVIGIDLGTSVSTVSELVWRAGQDSPEPVRALEVDQETPSGRYTSPMVPSIVCAQEGGPLVGEGAKVFRGRMADNASGLKQGRNIFWECKNHMGVTRTYHQAPGGYRSAREIGGHVLSFLLAAAKKESPTTIARTVVTVPASFRASQREDTQEAAELAGLHVASGDLVDEPVSAFLDYIFTHDISRLELSEKPKNVLVFDFGGGTCDVAIFKVSITKSNEIKMAPLTVSRYHRLGGGDIDAAIVHNCLIPQLSAQNNLSRFDLSYEEKVSCVAPALQSIAETLKIGLCKEIARLNRLGQYPEGEDRQTVFKRNPGVTECRLKDGRILQLNGPVLTATEFDKVLAPFLDRDFIFARETDYSMTCSIFAPLTDALTRAGISAEDVSVCLMAGSSSFIPKVQQELDLFFGQGYVVNFSTPEDAKLAISRGAAFHAMALERTGTGVVQPMIAEGVFIRTSNGLAEMVPASTHLPFPADGDWASRSDLTVPRFSPGAPRLLKVELVTQDQMKLFTASWDVPESVPTGSPLRFQYRIDANQALNLRLNVASAPEKTFWEWKKENPLVNIEYPESKRETIEEIEENIRTAQIPRTEIPKAILKVADLTAELGQRERALDLMKKALAAKQGKDAGLLNKMAILCGEMRDHEKEEKFYRESGRLANWGSPLFNLALSEHRRGLYHEALADVDSALAVDREAPYLVLRGMIADSLQDPMLRDQSLNEAMTLFGPISAMTPWELGWYLTAASQIGDETKAGEAREEQRRRGKRKDEPSAEGMLPDRGSI